MTDYARMTPAERYAEWDASACRYTAWGQQGWTYFGNQRTTDLARDARTRCHRWAIEAGMI